MKLLASLLVLTALSLPVQLKSQDSGGSTERLGTVAFSNSCAPFVQASFNRGVALLHDFWYEEAQRQFEQVAKADPDCAMAHWGIAMSVFHQIWNRPKPDTMTLGWSEVEKAQSPAAKTSRERGYSSALSAFYAPGKQEFETRADAYSAAMAKLSHDYPDDIDAAAFYALSILAAKKPTDSSLDHERQALAVLTPLFAKYPDHPGLAHYIIHACDNPTLAPQGLHAAERYGSIAPSAAHSAHMPGHIFARLGMWQPDIDANLASVAAGRKAFRDHPSALFDQLHAYDFLLYAYLQSGQEAKAWGVVETTAALLTSSEGMMSMPGMAMSEMIPRYRAEFPTIYDLETRDWKAAASLTPAPGAPPELQTFTFWARIMAEGHLHQPEAAQADLSKFMELTEEIKKGPHAYYAESTGAQVAAHEAAAWAAFAQGNPSGVGQMRVAADLQDKVGQGEVDIPAREMLADMLLELHQPRQALIEYENALEASPNRFNGLFNAGQAAEAVGDKAKAAKFYMALMKATGNGAQSKRTELAHVKAFLESNQLAER